MMMAMTTMKIAMTRHWQGNNDEGDVEDDDEDDDNDANEDDYAFNAKLAQFTEVEFMMIIWEWRWWCVDMSPHELP